MATSTIKDSLYSNINNTLVTDLNTLLSTHAVNLSVRAYGSSASNKPSGNTGVVITQGSGNYRGQFVVDLGGTMFTRTYVNGTISAWVTK